MIKWSKLGLVKHNTKYNPLLAKKPSNVKKTTGTKTIVAVRIPRAFYLRLRLKRGYFEIAEFKLKLYRSKS